MSGGGAYAIKRKIATGTMAEVFLAAKRGEAGFERDVVLKRLLPHLAADEGVVDLFLHEARVLARLQHPHIAAVVDLGRRDDDYFMVLEYVDGGDLLTLIERLAGTGERVPLAEALYTTCCVLDALRCAHNCVDDGGAPLGLVHRDVTAQNVLVSRHGEVKLVDFGIARSKLRRGTAVGLTFGRPGTHAPEVVAGMTADARADVYGACALLHHLATGAPPQAPPPAAGAAPLPAALVRILDKGLCPDPAGRFPTVHALHTEIERFLLVDGAFQRARGDRASLAALVTRALVRSASAQQQQQPDVDTVRLDGLEMTSAVAFRTALDARGKSHSTSSMPDAAAAPALDDADWQTTELDIPRRRG